MKLSPANIATLVATVLAAAIHAYINAGGPPLVVDGFPVLLVVLTLLGVFQAPPSGKPRVPPLTVLALAFFAFSSVYLVACIRVVTPSQQASDFATAEACIVAHWGEPVTQIAGECVEGEVAAAEDLIADVEFLIEQAQGSPDAGPLPVDAGTLVDPYRLDPHVASRLVVLRNAKVRP